MAAARVAVVGGGLAGLSAAARLKSSGHTVELFERSRLLGGRATSFEAGGEVVDNGQHVYLACCTAFQRFVADAGMAHALHLQPTFDVEVWSKGSRSRLRATSLPPPFHILASFVAYRYLSWSGKIRVARALLALQRKAARPQGTFAHWLQTHGQTPETVRAFWEPFLVPALNAPLDRMAAEEAAFVLQTAFLSDRRAARFGYATVPLAEIMETAARRLDAVHRATSVTRIDGDGAVTVSTANAGAVFDAAVLALSPSSLQRVLGSGERFGIAQLQAFEPFAIMDAHLWHNRGSLPFDFAAILDSPVQWIFQKRPGYLCCSLSAANAWATLANADVAHRAWAQVQANVLPLRGAALVKSSVTRNPEGTFLRKAGAPPPGARTNHPKIALAGAWTATGWPDTMESAVRSGETAANVVMESM